MRPLLWSVLILTLALTPAASGEGLRIDVRQFTAQPVPTPVLERSPECAAGERSFRLVPAAEPERAAYVGKAAPHPIPSCSLTHFVAEGMRMPQPGSRARVFVAFGCDQPGVLSGEVRVRVAWQGSPVGEAWTNVLSQLCDAAEHRPLVFRVPLRGIESQSERGTIVVSVLAPAAVAVGGSDSGLFLRTGTSAIEINGPAPGHVATAESVDSVSPLQPASAGSPAILAATASFGAILLLWRLRGPWLLGLLFARLRPDAVANHPLRGEILALVRSHPGIVLAEAGRALGLRRGTLRFHVASLVQAGLLMVHEQDGFLHLFAPGSDPSQWPRLALLRRPRPALAASIVHEHPGLSQRDLAQRLGVRPSTALRIARSLVANGLVRCQRAGRSLRYHPEPCLDDYLGARRLG